MRTGPRPRRSPFLFSACDVDFSGKIEPKELKAVVHYLMKKKAAEEGVKSFMTWQDVLYADIPEAYVVHLKANEFVNDVFTAAHDRGQGLSEKDLAMWHLKGGKEAKRLDNLFSINVTNARKAEQ